MLHVTATDGMNENADVRIGQTATSHVQRLQCVVTGKDFRQGLRETSDDDLLHLRIFRVFPALRSRLFFFFLTMVGRHPTMTATPRPEADVLESGTPLKDGPNGVVTRLVFFFFRRRQVSDEEVGQIEIEKFQRRGQIRHDAATRHVRCEVRSNGETDELMVMTLLLLLAAAAGT
jgi:hypothetical protein